MALQDFFFKFFISKDICFQTNLDNSHFISLYISLAFSSILDKLQYSTSRTQNSFFYILSNRAALNFKICISLSYIPSSLYYIQRYYNRSNGVQFPYITLLILVNILVLYSCFILSNNSIYSFILSQVCSVMGYIAFILSYFSCWVSPKCLYANSVRYTSILNAYKA